jgi:hypothetical protein
MWLLSLKASDGGFIGSANNMRLSRHQHALVASPA